MIGKIVSRLRGSTTFCNAQAAGRLGCLVHSASSEWGKTPSLEAFQEKFMLRMEWWTASAEKLPPRSVPCGEGRPPILIFIDWLARTKTPESDAVKYSVTLPMVTPRTFGRCMWDGIRSKLFLPGKKKQIVGQAELHPLTVALRFWQSALSGRDAVFFIDNDAARFGALKGSPPTAESAWLIYKFWSQAIEIGCHVWLHRVPSVSNPADGPSRENWQELASIFPGYHLELRQDKEEANDVAAWGKV